MAETTLFQKILAREVPADIVYEDDKCGAFRDINPQAPTHILIVPRSPIPSISAMEAEDAGLIGHLFYVARVIAEKEELTRGFRLVLNDGEDGLQTVPHIHVHLIGGKKLGWPPG